MTFDVLLPHGREDKRSEEGQADLAAVGVAGEHEIDQWRLGDEGGRVGVVGLVRHEDDGRSGVGGMARLRSGLLVPGSSTPQSQRRSPLRSMGTCWSTSTGVPLRGEGSDDHRGADFDVVIAKEGVAQGRGERAENFGAAMGRRTNCR